MLHCECFAEGPDREPHPIEQGLRLRPHCGGYNSFSHDREPHPIEQGLRPLRCVLNDVVLAEDREPHPIEQGLRLLIRLSMQ